MDAALPAAIVRRPAERRTNQATASTHIPILHAGKERKWDEFLEYNSVDSQIYSQDGFGPQQGPMLMLLLTLVQFTPLTQEQVLYALNEITPFEIRGLIEPTVSSLFNRSSAIVSWTAIPALWTAARSELHNRTDSGAYGESRYSCIRLFDCGFPAGESAAAGKISVDDYAAAAWYCDGDSDFSVYGVVYVFAEPLSEIQAPVPRRSVYCGILGTVFVCIHNLS